MIKKHEVKSCCSKNFIWELESPIQKHHLNVFKDAGYIVPVHMLRAGMFFVEWKGLIASAPFGSSRIQIKCTMRDCNKLLSSLENLLNQVTEK
jgi:hypothetical protein